MHNNSRKPVVLMLVDGFGISSSWQGNAIAAANLQNFEFYWKNYRHLVLRQPAGSEVSLFKNYSLLSLGKKHSELVPLSENRDLGTALESLKNHNSSAHFFVLMSKSQTQSLDNLASVLRVLHAKKITNAYIHIVVDASYNNEAEFSKELTSLDGKLAELGVGLVVSITGIEQFSAKNNNRLLQSIFCSKGDTSYSVKQALSRNKPQKPAQFPTKLIKSSFDTRVSDFDLIYLTEEMPTKFMDFFESVVISSKSSSTGRFPKFLTFFSSEVFSSNIADEVKFLSRKPIGWFLTDYLSRTGHSQIVISDSGNIAQINQFFVGDKKNIDEFVVDAGKNNLSSTNEIISRTISTIRSAKYDFIVANFPSLLRFATMNKFSDCVNEAKLIDLGLGKIADLLQSYDGYLVFMAAMGGAESLVEKENNLRDNTQVSRKVQSLPFVVISDRTLSREHGDVFQETITASQSLEDVNGFFKIILNDEKN